VNKMMGYEFMIIELENGWTVEFFTHNGPMANDHISCFPTFEAALKAVVEWREMMDKGGEGL
jgi:hypothetical protein